MAEDYYTHKQDIKGDGICRGSYTDFSNSTGTSINVLWGHGGTPAPDDRRPLGRRPRRLDEGADGNCTAIHRNQCIHAFADTIGNVSAASAEGCCFACRQMAKCVAWNWFHLGQPQSPGRCFLKSKVSDANKNHTMCDSGVFPAPQTPERDYSAFIFAKEAQRIVAHHAKVYKPQGIPLFMYL